MALTLSEFVTNYEGKKSDHETEQKGNLVPYATRYAAITQPKVSLVETFSYCLFIRIIIVNIETRKYFH